MFSEKLDNKITARILVKIKNNNMYKQWRSKFKYINMFPEKYIDSKRCIKNKTQDMLNNCCYYEQKISLLKSSNNCSSSLLTILIVIGFSCNLFIIL